MYTKKPHPFTFIKNRRRGTPAILLCCLKTGAYIPIPGVLGAPVPQHRQSFLCEKREDKKERRKADEQVDEILQPGHRAEKEIHDIPVAAHIVAKRDETPIEPTDYDENERNTVI